MSFNYTQSFIDSGLSYSAYKQHIKATLAQPPFDEEAAKLRPRMQEYIKFMEVYDDVYVVSDDSKKAVEESPDCTWVVIAEGWCADAAFNLPIMAAIARALPAKVNLRIFLRDSNPELMDANLTDGGRSIPKLIILDEDLQEVANWGPRPAGLHFKVKRWREEGLSMPQIFPRMYAWYDADASHSFQAELELLLGAVLSEKA